MKPACKCGLINLTKNPPQYLEPNHSHEIQSSYPICWLVNFIIFIAVTVSTDPVGFITLTIKGTDTSDGLSAVSVPMLSASLHSGVIYDVDGQTITDNNASWSTGDFATPDPNGNPSHYIMITNHSDDTKVGLSEITASDGGNRLSQLPRMLLP